MDFAIAIDFSLKPVAQGVNALGPHTVETTGKFIRTLAEFTTSVQIRQRQLDGWHVGILFEFHWNPPAIIANGAGAVSVNVDEDVFAVASQVLVNGVVHDLENAVVQASFIRIANVHPRPVPHVVRKIEFGDLGTIVCLTGINASIDCVCEVVLV
jgi:hypothetical protein